MELQINYLYNLRLNNDSDLIIRISVGNKFQYFGAATAKAVSENLL